MVQVTLTDKTHVVFVNRHGNILEVSEDRRKILQVLHQYPGMNWGNITPFVCMEKENHFLRLLE